MACGIPKWRHGGKSWENDDGRPTNHYPASSRNTEDQYRLHSVQPYDQLQMNKVSARWVPRMLMDMQKQNTNEYLSFSLPAADHNHFFFNWIVISDDLWIHHMIQRLKKPVKQENMQFTKISKPNLLSWQTALVSVFVCQGGSSHQLSWAWPNYQWPLLCWSFDQTACQHQGPEAEDVKSRSSSTGREWNKIMISTRMAILSLCTNKKNVGWCMGTTQRNLSVQNFITLWHSQNFLKATCNFWRA